jgi:hypothetical protein
VLIDKLANLVPGFPGKANQTRCFAHVLNLVAKSIIKQFDQPKKSGMDSEDEGLAEIANSLESDDEDANGCDDIDQDLDDDVEGWIDETALLSTEQKGRLRADTQPIQVVIVKVSVFVQNDHCRLISI